MIKTSDISLSKKRYFQILAGSRFGQSWYIYLLPFLGAVAIHFAMEESELLVKFLVVYGLVNPLWILIYLTIHVNSKKAEFISLPRHYEITNTKLTAHHADSSTNEFEIEDIFETKQNSKELLLYFSKSEFIYLPYSAFEPKELESFKATLQKESKLK